MLYSVLSFLEYRDTALLWEMEPQIRYNYRGCSWPLRSLGDLLGGLSRFLAAAGTRVARMLVTGTSPVDGGRLPLALPPPAAAAAVAAAAVAAAAVAALVGFPSTLDPC